MNETKLNDITYKHCKYCKTTVNCGKYGDLYPHYQICPSYQELKELQAQSYYCKDINSNSSSLGTPFPALTELNTTEVLELVKKIKKVYHSLHIEIHVKELPKNKDYFYHSITLNEYLTKNKQLHAKKQLKRSKHYLQETSIYKHIEPLVNNSNLLIELGAGKAGLSNTIIHTNANISTKSLITIDNRKLKIKKVSSYKEKVVHYKRIKMDIKDLIIKHLPLIKDDSKIIFIAKHLCGKATDFGIKAIQHFIDDDKQAKVQVAMALCCHHLCNWSDYIGKDLFIKHNLTAKDFYYIKKMTSWAPTLIYENKIRKKQHDKKRRKLNEHHNHKMSNQKMLKMSSQKMLNMNNQKMLKMSSQKMRNMIFILSYKEKFQLGKECKLLIDYGRLLSFKNKAGKLYQYVDISVTPENILLIIE